MWANRGREWERIRFSVKDRDKEPPHREMSLSCPVCRPKVPLAYFCGFI